MRRRLFVPVALIALFAAAYGGWWLYAAASFEDAILRWAEARRAEGRRVAVEGLAMGGFPLWITAVADRVELGDEQPAPWHWAGPRTEASARPWSFRRIVVSAPGAHRIETPGPDGARAVTPVEARDARGEIALDEAGRIVQLDILLRAVTARAPDGSLWSAERAAVAAVPVAADAAPSAADPRARESLRLALVLENVDLPSDLKAGLGRRIHQAEASLAVRGEIPAARPRQALEAWRAAGGTLEVTKLRLVWGEFQLEGTGTLALDDELQPAGALTARLWGVGHAIDALVAQGEMRPRDGATAKTVLRTLAKRNDQPGIPPEIEVPVTVQERRVRAGPALIATLPRLAWPGDGPAGAH